jgi:YfiH family protein
MLPQPSDGFAWTQVAGEPALVCPALDAVAAHFFTTRDWQLGSAPASRREQAWDEVCAAAAANPSSFIRLRQVHGDSVVVRRAGESQPSTGGTAGLPEADIIVADDPRLALAIQTADCVPLLLADRRKGVVAAAHAGWRGLAGHVPRTAVDALRRDFGCRPEDLVAAIGPSIAACCYEVGPDVRDAFRRGGFESAMGEWFFDTPQPTAANPSMPALPAGRRADHWFFDGWAAATTQLLQVGVAASQIHVARLCTASHPCLCSFRRDGDRSGRMAAVIRARSPQG